MSKENSNKNNDDNKNISKKKDDINENKMYEEELKKLLYDENKTTISTNEVADSLIMNEKIKKIRNMKFDSDDLFKNNKYEEAINQYKETINTLLEEFSEKNDINNLILENLKGEIIMPCYQNIALCYMKLKNWLKMKTYTKKVLEIDKDNIKANCRLCLANIPELEELEKIYEKNKLNADGNNDEFLKKMGRKLANGKINMYSDKKTTIEIEKVENTKKWYNFQLLNKIKKCFRKLVGCCKKRRKTKKIK